jgi:hypothetical protein
MRNPQSLKGFDGDKPMETEHFQDAGEARLYAALSKERWETVEVCRIQGANEDLLLKFYNGKKKFDKKS